MKTIPYRLHCAFWMPALVFGLWSCSRESPPGIAGMAGERPAVVPGTALPAIEDSAEKDGWQSEVFSESVLSKLKGLDKLFAAPDTITAEALEELCAADCASSSLRPGELEEVLRDRVFIVRRARASPTAGPSLRGREGLARELRELAELFRGGREVRSQFKVFRVELPPAGASSADPRISVYFHLSGVLPRGSLQVNATWRLGWDRPSSSDSPRLKSVQVESHEEVTVLSPSGPLFADCTEAVLARNPIFDRQLRPGIDQWMGIIEARFGIDVGGWQGLAIGDVNGDGLDDLYICQPGGLPKRLFIQNADGTATERSAEAGVDWLESTHAALLVDMDNDGDQDLLLSIEEGILFLVNDGMGHFKVGAARPIPAAIPYSLAAADYDEDGDLDLYVCCYNPRRGVDRHLVFARPVPYHDANNGGPNVLLRNDGNWRFREVTKQVGLDVNNRRFSYAAAWEDYDNDGDLDLFVANDFGRKNLYRNEGGHFRDLAAEAGAEDIGPGMSAAWGDYDNDGFMDIYASNMFSSAGNRITHQEKFQPAASELARAQLRRHARGNTLLRNLGNGTFQDVEAGVTMGRWAWGSLFVDLNNDGWQDLLVLNGFITQEDSSDL